jgi:hypothetical protein
MPGACLPHLVARHLDRLCMFIQLRRADILRKGQEGQVRAECDVLKSALLVSSMGGAEWIVRLHYSFQDRDNLYLVCGSASYAIVSLSISFIPGSTWAGVISSTY